MSPSTCTRAGRSKLSRQALAIGLQEDGKLAVARRHPQQVGGPLAQLPEGGARPGPAPGEEEGAGRVFPKAGREQRGRAGRCHDQVLDLARVDQDGVDVGRLVGLGQAQDDAVVAPDRLDLDVVAGPPPGLDGHGPRRVDLGAEGREDGQPPVPELVAEAFDDDLAVGGQQAAGGLLLLGDIGAQVAQGELVEIAVGGEGLVAAGGELAGEGPDSHAELVGASEGVAVPERHLARDARRRRHDDAVTGDVLDPPRRGPEDERLADAALVDHLLVELSDATPFGGEHAEQPAVGDRPPAGDGEHPGPGSGREGPGQTVPDQPGAQLGELVARVAPREHVEHALEGLDGGVLEGVGPPHHHGHVVDGHGAFGAGDHGHDLLGEHVEGVTGDAGLLDGPGVHALRDHRRDEQVMTEFGENATLGGFPHAVPGPADALQAGRHGGGGLDLHDEVDGAHVDPELQAGGGDEGREPARLEGVLDLEALLAGDGAVVGPHQLRRRARPDPMRAVVGHAGQRSGRRAGAVPAGRGGVLLGGELVEARRQAFGQAPGVDEDQRGAVLPDEGQQLGVDRRPDRRPHLGAAGGRPPQDEVLVVHPRRRSGRSGAGRAPPCPRRARRSAGGAPCAPRRRRS